MSRLKDLQEEKAKYQLELEELHIYEPNMDWYKARREYLEYQIACIEEVIEDELASIRENNNVSLLFLIVLWAMVLTGLGILIFM